MQSVLLAPYVLYAPNRKKFIYGISDFEASKALESNICSTMTVMGTLSITVR